MKQEETRTYVPQTGPESGRHAATRQRYGTVDWSTVKRTTAAGVGTALIWLGFALTTPNFLTALNVRNIFTASSNIAIIGAGLTVALIVGEIDLSVGAVEGLASALVSVLLLNDGFSLVPAIALALAMGAVVGAINGVVVWKLTIPSFIGTLAMLGIAQGTAYLLTSGQPLTGLPPDLLTMGSGLAAGVPVPALIAVGVIAVLHIILRRIRVGRHIFAVGGNSTSAAAVGIPVGRVKLLALTISGLTGSIGGLILAARLNGGSGDFGQNDILSAVAAAVIGGTSLFGGVGSVIGTAIGAILITTITDGLVLLNVQAFWQQIAVGLIIIAAMLVNRIVGSEAVSLRGAVDWIRRLKETEGLH